MFEVLGSFAEKQSGADSHNLLESIGERQFSDEKDEKGDLLLNAKDEFLEGGGQRLREAELIGLRSALGLPACLLTHVPSSPLFRHKHAGGASRRTRGVVPRHSRGSHGWLPP